MNLDLSETQQLLQETVRGYLESEVPYERIRELEKSNGWDQALWKDLVAQGWLSLPFDEAHGGGGGSLVDLGILVEELARRAAIAPVLECVVAGRALAAAGADEALAALLAGDAVVVPAVPEPGETLEVAADGRLTGELGFVDFGQFATHHLVAAADGLRRVACDGDGVRCEPLRSVGRTPLAAVRYDGVPSEAIGGTEAVADLVRLARTLAAVQCAGAMAAALDQTVAYAKVRKQFDAPIGSFQAVRHHCANMASRVASARLLAYEALDRLGRGQASDSLVAAAKAAASRSAPDVTMYAHQIHGGNGVIEENDLYFTTLRAKERSLAWGSLDECLAVMAAHVDEPVDWL